MFLAASAAFLLFVEQLSRKGKENAVASLKIAVQRFFCYLLHMCSFTNLLVLLAYRPNSFCSISVT